MLQRLLGVVGLLLGSAVWAHPLDLGRVDLSVQPEESRLTVELNAMQAALVLGIPLSLITPEQVARRMTGVALVKQDGEPCFGSDVPSVELASGTLRVTWRMRCASGSEVQVELPFLVAASPSLELVGQAQLPDGIHLFTMNPSRPSTTIRTQRAWSLGRFILMGIRHIGAAPSEWRGANGLHFPEGIDHILFVVALVLGSGRVGRILLTVTGFTFGHSLTLALAATGIVHVPTRWVEPAIALSIVYVAVEDLFRHAPRGRWGIAFGFGLIHGLGFASALRNLGLQGVVLAQALVGFNVGVELGQAAIVLVLAPLLMWLGRGGRRAEWVGRGLAVPIAVVAIVWLVQRSAALF